MSNSYILSSTSFVFSGTTFPVFKVPFGSISIRCTSSTVTGRWSIPEHHIFIAEFDCQLPINNHNQFIFIVVMMPFEFTFILCQIIIWIIQIRQQSLDSNIPGLIWVSRLDWFCPLQSSPKLLYILFKKSFYFFVREIFDILQIKISFL